MPEKTIKPLDDVRRFIGKNPKSKYTFDSERDASSSTLCREQSGDKQRECMIIHMRSTQLFQTMQDLGFFCVLPFEPTKTHIECTPKPGV